MKSKREVSTMDTNNLANTHGEVDSVDFAVYLSKKGSRLWENSQCHEDSKTAIYLL